MSDALRAEIARLIALRRAAPIEKARYFWPLARPAWTVDECEAALLPWIEAQTTMWERTKDFEATFARAFGYDSAALCNSGSSADLLAALLLRESMANIPGTVLVPAVTWPTQVWACLMAGLTVRLVDVDPITLTAHPNAILDAAEEEERARRVPIGLFVTHLLGLPWDMTATRAATEHLSIALVEDCCEALGAAWQGQPVGTFGLAGTHSLFVAHHCSTGEGGVTGINDQADLPFVRAARAHGWTRNCDDVTPWADELADWRGDPRYTFVTWGGNFRPTESQAAVGLRQLERWPAIREARARVAARMLAALADAPGCRVPQPLVGATPSWFAVPILCESEAARSALVDRLEAQGIETRAIVAGNLARQPALAYGQFRDRVTRGALPGADVIHDCGCYVGILPDATESELCRIEEVLAHGV
ncbi:MAG: DegT/DnrJ/EryC1/StrS family aminotransferase [bacterium]|nr:DegT/DnrJ/EryC1/StrS family aminotransferase [bacterium]